MKRLWMITASLAIACGSSLPHPTYSAQTPSALTVVAYAPPPARVESVPSRPSSEAVWVDGEWQWARRRWLWLAGRWVKPATGTTFSPWVVVRGADGTVYIAPGIWKDATGKSVAGPPALASATIEGGDVVDAEGKSVDTGPTVREPGRK